MVFTPVITEQEHLRLSYRKQRVHYNPAQPLALLQM